MKSKNRLMRHMAPAKVRFAMSPPDVGLNPQYRVIAAPPKLHPFASQVAPCLNQRASHFATPRNKSYKLGRKLNCYQQANNGSEGPTKLWRRGSDGVLRFEIDC